MTTTELDKKLEEIVARRPRLLVKLLSIVKKDFDARITEYLQQTGYKDFKIGDMVLLVNISPEGTINNELAKRPALPSRR